MVIVKNYGDPTMLKRYYQTQAGYGLPGFHGAPVMYGAGVGGIFRRLFRMAVPLFKKGVDIAKPHLKTAARNIAQDVVSRVSQGIMNKVVPQQGSGFMYLKRRGGLKRKTNVRKGPPEPNKRSRQGTRKQRTVEKRSGKNKRKKKAHCGRLKDVL